MRCEMLEMNADVCVEIGKGPEGQEIKSVARSGVLVKDGILYF